MPTPKVRIYDGLPTMGWAMRANKMQDAARAAVEYDERARKYREANQDRTANERRM